MASLPYPRTLYKMNMNLHTTLVSSAFFAFCLAASNVAAANNSPSHPINSQLSTLNPLPSPPSALRPLSVSSCRTLWRRRFAR